MRLIFIFITISFLLYSIPSSGDVYNLKPGDIEITGFEFYPNSLGGNVGSFGAVKGSGYSSEYVYWGNKSYKLVFAKDALSSSKDEVDYGTTGRGMRRIKRSQSPDRTRKIKWAVFMIDMGPVEDESVVPVRIQPMNISRFRYLVFWIRGRRGGEQFKIYFRDVHASKYDPQLKLKPKVRVSKKWRAVAVNLQRIKRKIDLKNIVQIGIGFGLPDGGRPGDVLYIDNFVLVK